MPIVWRLARAEFAEQLDGDGARLFGGRWNSRGVRALYTASHLSLSVLETYVHVPPALREYLPILRAVQISVPDQSGATRVLPQDLIDLLANADPLAACRRLGDAWLARNDQLVLEVPSILVPEETNVVINPAHPQMHDVRIVASRTFRFDPRLAATR